jgi:DNA-binding response OmpR family regulator
MKTTPIKTLMFVEDDPVLMFLYIRKFQEKENVKIMIAEDGEKAEDILSRIQPDVLLTGIHMPKTSGLELLEFIQKKGWKFPIIVLTNMENAQFKEKAFSLGAAKYLIKKELNIMQLQKVLEPYLA